MQTFLNITTDKIRGQYERISKLITFFRGEDSLRDVLQAVANWSQEWQCENKNDELQDWCHLWSRG